MARLLLVALAVLALGACGPHVDLARGLQVEPVSTGWNAAVAEPGQTKIVPVVSFRLRNVSSERLRTLQVNAVFHRIGDEAEWGSGFVPTVAKDGLAPGSETPTLTVASPLGYTGSDPKTDLLWNSQFVDVQVRLFAKTGSASWTPIGEYPIQRRLLAGD